MKILNNFLNNQTTNIRYGKFKRLQVVTEENQIPKGTTSIASSEWNPSQVDGLAARRRRGGCTRKCATFFTMFCGRNQVKSQDEIISRYAADIGAILSSQNLDSISKTASSVDKFSSHTGSSRRPTD